MSWMPFISLVLILFFLKPKKGEQQGAATSKYHILKEREKYKKGGGLESKPPSNLQNEN